MRLFSKNGYRWKHTKISMVHNPRQSPLQHHLVRMDIINNRLCSSLWYLHYPITLTEKTKFLLSSVDTGIHRTHCKCHLVYTLTVYPQTVICYGKPAHEQFTNKGVSTNCTLYSNLFFLNTALANLSSAFIGGNIICLLQNSHHKEDLSTCGFLNSKNLV